MGLEMYVEVIVIALVGLMGMGVTNVAYLVSTLLTLLCLSFALFFIIWIPLFTMRNFARINLSGDKFANKYWCVFAD